MASGALLSVDPDLEKAMSQSGAPEALEGFKGLLSGRFGDHSQLEGGEDNTGARSQEFIKEVEDAIDASKTDLEKERICRKYTGQEDYCLLKRALLNYDTPKHKLDYSFIEALKAKGYYRGNN